MQEIMELQDLARELTVLYADDEEKIRIGTEQFLLKFFSRVVVARNGQEALEKYHNDAFDLVITDIKMPVMNGIELIEKIREQTPNQVILIMSAYNFDDFIYPNQPHGADAFLGKPVSHTEFIHALTLLCRKIRGIEENKEEKYPFHVKKNNTDERLAALEKNVNEIKNILNLLTTKLM